MDFLGVGPAEAFVVVIVTILVVGPHRFPEIARQAAHWVRIARRYATVVTADVRGAMEEIKTEAEELKATATEFQSELNEQQDALHSVREVGDEISSSFRQTQTELRVISSEATSGSGSTSVTPAAPATPSSQPDGELATPREISSNDASDPVADPTAPASSTSGPGAPGTPEVPDTPDSDR